MAQVAGNLQRIRNGERRYAITPRIPGGFVQPAVLQKFIDVANTFHATLKITGAQRIMITNLKAEYVDKAWEMLGMTPAHSVANRVRSVTMCPGITFCKRAKQDSIKLGMQLEKKYTSLEMPSKMKMSVSGCPNSCTEGALKDIGVIGSVNGWSIYAGGSGGAHPRIGDLIAEVATEAEVLTIVDNMVNFYKENAHIERIGEFIDRIGLEAFKEAVLGDAYVPAEATAQVAEPVATAPATEPEVKLPGVGSADELEQTEYPEITADTIVRDIVDVYPDCIPVLQSIGMGCLGCPSSTNEPIWQAAAIHGLEVSDLVAKLNAVRARVLGINEAEDDGPFGPGKKITKDTIIRELIEVYPNTIPTLQGIGMGCLGCPSSTNEPIWQAAEIHGIDVDQLVDQLNLVKGA